ncbi:CAF17-like 4Fe-4S cluster assembly/insertion protein YgfZ [Varunaivibrio sulfuroxidans]|uniref:Uncharacterized protein n=1 Tax=Varunaivibrio sulfuroxidans TaxID=1773489 RepID=A0A4R3JC12_9PROT|nr:folate-binding protein YgfZ [Varunaivibrio sulfuroxidans]TCS62613.1 hypothetical protein EDD55_105160 [Varunaivibrio sulfuroxidans]WES30719.1 folate-binding protein YgfZ [Varunaivibrio sulfuroxidans]
MTTPASAPPSPPAPPAPMHVWLEHRGVIGLEGPDAADFLQGLVSNDVSHVSPQNAIWAAFLTPQGKYLHDFFIAQNDARLLIDCDAGRLGDLLRRLSMYKLRADVTLSDLSDRFAVGVGIGAAASAILNLNEDVGATIAMNDAIAFVDPRHRQLGCRIIAPKTNLNILNDAGIPSGKFDDYETLRISLGIPDGPRDLRVEKSILLENGFDELHGIDWDKGCYMGQELTARTKYRGLVRKRLMPVAIDGPAPAPGTPIMAGDREAGEMRTHAGDMGLALLRLEFVAEDVPLIAGSARLSPRKPEWAEF